MAQSKTQNGINGGNNNIQTGAYEALQFEYSHMASWYDWFWADYLKKAFQLPLILLINAIRTLQQQHTPNTPLTIVDVACGTGEFIKRAQERLAQEELDHGDAPLFYAPLFYGIEPCPEMLAEAMPKSDKTTWIQSSAEALPLADTSADVVCSTSAFHFFRNKPLALHQMYRILRPGGRLIVTDWCANYLLVRLYHMFELLRWNFRFSHRYPGPLRHRTLQQLVEETGFQEVTVETYTVRFWTVVIWGMQTVTAVKP